MSAIQKNMRYLKEKQKNLNFFSQYLDISKLRLLQILNEEQDALNVLNNIKFSHIQFLNKINGMFFKNEDKSSKITENENTWKIKPENKIYFLVDSKEHDIYSETIYKKLEEILANKVRKNDVIVTFGTRVNLICQKLELNIIQHFPYDVYLNQDDFIDKVANIIEVGLKNKLFTEARLVIAQHNKDNKEIINKKLVPFETNNQELRFLNDNLLINNSNKNKADSKLTKNTKEEYLDFFNSLDFKSVHWFPNIMFFKYKFIKSIIKQNIVELTIVEKIQRLKMEIYLLDEKRNKLEEELVVVGRWINRIRKEKTTEATIILHSAFKLKLQSEKKPEEILIRKRKELDLISNKKVLVKKGSR